jgi:hypothetical protein
MPGWCRQWRRVASDPLLARTKSKASRLAPASLVTGPGSNFEPVTRIGVTRPPGE